MAMNKQLAEQIDLDSSQIIEQQDRIAELEKELGFWMGEYQDDRPEMIEYRSLANLKSADRTPEQRKRIREIVNHLQREHEDAPELRVKITELELEVERQDMLLHQVYENEKKLGKKFERLNDWAAKQILNLQGHKHLIMPWETNG